MKKNELKAGVVLSYLVIIVQNLSLLLYTPLMIHYLGKSEYGTYNLVFSLAAYLNLLSGGLTNSYVRFYYKANGKKEDLAQLNGVYVVGLLVLSGVTLLCGFAITANFGGFFGRGLTPAEIRLAQMQMVFLVFNIVLTFFAGYFEAYIAAGERFIFPRLVQLGKNILTPAVSVLLLVLGARVAGYLSLGLVMVTTAATLLSLLVNAWYCFKKLSMQVRVSQFDFGIFKTILKFSFFVFLTIIVAQINSNIGKLLLGVFTGTGAVAVFSVAMTLYQGYGALSAAIGNVFIPRANQLVAANADDDAITQLFVQVGRLQFIVLSLILTGFIAFGHTFIRLWAGPGYQNAYYIAIMLLVPVTVPWVQTIGESIQMAKNIHRFRSVVYLAFAAVNLVVSALLIRRIGLFGAAIGTMCSLILGHGLVMNLYYQKRVGVNIKYFWQEIWGILKSILLPFALGCALNWGGFLGNLWVYLACLAGYCVAFGACLYRWGLNPGEKQMVKNVVAKLRRRNP